MPAVPRSSHTVSRIAQLAFTLALVAALFNFSIRLSSIRSILPIVSRWSNPITQHHLQLDDAPYPFDLLRTAESILPRDATVLLITPGRDVRHREYVTYHRALYWLAPRPIWWLTPAPPDDTWESHWWMSAPLTLESVRAIAAQKHVSHVLTDGLAQPLATGRKIAEQDGGYLLQLDDGATLLSEQPPDATDFWPIQVALAIGLIWTLGHTILAMAARTGYRAGGVEAAALSWALGAGLASFAMLWLNAIGLSLTNQVISVSLLAVPAAWWSWRARWRSRTNLQNTHTPSPRLHRLSSGVFNLALLSFLVFQIVLVSLMAIGQPLHTWDSWVTWGMKARIVFLERHISPTVYLDPTRGITHLDYPLLVPLVESWFYTWLGAPDDRLAGLPSLLFYLALIGVCYSSLRRRGVTQIAALVATVVVAAMTHIAGAAAAVYADVPLAVYATTAVVYLSLWLDKGERGALVIAALSAGLMPWTKREGWVLLVALAVATIVVSRGHRRAWPGVAAIGVAAALLAGPWWGFVALNGIADIDFLPLTVATLQSNMGRLPFIGWRVLLSVLSPDWNFIWPLALIFAIAVQLRDRFRLRSMELMPLTAMIYLAAMGMAYIFSTHVPFQQHVVSSIDRLVAQVAPLPVLWIACRALASCQSSEV